MKYARFVITLMCLVAASPAGVALRASDDARVPDPNYALTSRWTLPKINKLIFDVQVAPHWLEFSDRFWYSYETHNGKRYFLVDPAAAAGAPGKPGARAVKAPLFD